MWVCCLLASSLIIYSSSFSMQRIRFRIENMYFGSRFASFFLIFFSRFPCLHRPLQSFSSIHILFSISTLCVDFCCWHDQSILWRYYLPSFGHVFGFRASSTRGHTAGHPNVKTVMRLPSHQSTCRMPHFVCMAISRCSWLRDHN